MGGGGGGRDRGGEGAASGNLGNCLDSLGHYEQALVFHETSLQIAQEIGDKDAEGGCFGNLANVHESLGQSGAHMKERLLAIAREAGEISLFGDLSKCSFALGQYAQAIVLPRAEPFGNQVGASAPRELARETANRPLRYSVRSERLCHGVLAVGCAFFGFLAALHRS